MIGLGGVFLEDYVKIQSCSVSKFNKTSCFSPHLCIGLMKGLLILFYSGLVGCYGVISVYHFRKKVSEEGFMFLCGVKGSRRESRPFFCYLMSVGYGPGHLPVGLHGRPAFASRIFILTPAIRAGHDGARFVENSFRIFILTPAIRAGHDGTRFVENSLPLLRDARNYFIYRRFGAKAGERAKPSPRNPSPVRSMMFNEICMI